MIALVDYGMGNLGSVANALRFIECEFEITSAGKDGQPGTEDDIKRPE